MAIKARTRLWSMIRAARCGEWRNRSRAERRWEISRTKERFAERYNRLAEEYDQRRRPYIDATQQAVLDAVQLEGNERVLDVPCGTGELEQRPLGRWPDLRITGADTSPGMLEQAKDAEGRVTWIEADVSPLPFADGEFTA